VHLPTRHLGPSSVRLAEGLASGVTSLGREA